MNRDYQPYILPSHVGGNAATHLTYQLLALAILVHVYLCWHWRAPLAFDARVAYLPFANRLLSDGWSFLLSERSVWYPIGSYGYPALLGANVRVIEGVNLVMSASIVLMLYRIALHAHSVRGGLIAAWLYALSPSIASMVINVLTEPPFLFFCAVWLWAVSELGASGQRRWIWIAGLALGCAVNIRASLTTFIFASAILAMVAAKRSIAAGDTWKRIASAQYIAAAIVGIEIAKNWIQFGLPQITTGGGNAFYLGNHTLTGGYDPDIVGLFFDVNGVAQEHQLTVEADRKLYAVGWNILQAQSLQETLANYWRKVGAFLFYPNVLTSDSMFTLRSLRICLFAAGFVAMIRGWRTPTLLLAASVTAYQVVVHVPLLYTPRYSEGAVDLWLAVLAGCGFATISKWSQRDVALFSVALIAACYAGKSFRHLDAPVAPLHLTATVPHRIVWEQRSIHQMSHTGLIAGSADETFVAAANDPSIQIDLPDIEGVTGNAIVWHRPLFLTLDVWTPPTRPRCAKGRIEFRPDAVSHGGPVTEHYYPFRLARELAPQTFSFGISVPTPTWQSGINGPGTFRIKFACDQGAQLRLDRFAIAESTYADHYAHKNSPLTPATVVPVIEYHNADTDSYFITWVADEIAVLDAEKELQGWTRTGQSFMAYAYAQAGTSQMCRYGRDASHFYGLGANECDRIARKYPRHVIESTNFPVYFYNSSDGNCPENTVPVYRVSNNRNDVNHRYLIDRTIRDEMVARGWIADGNGPEGVFMCAPR